LTQYGQACAADRGRTVLLRLGEQIELEMLTAGEGELASPAEAERTSAGEGPAEVLERLRLSTSPVRRVLVAPDGQMTATVAASWLAALPGWTLICGADQAARAAAEQQVRALVQQAPTLAQRPLALWVVGTEPGAAREAGEQLRSSLASLVTGPVRFAGCQPRMEPVESQPLGSFPANAQVTERLQGWLDQVTEQTQPAASNQTAHAEGAPAPGNAGELGEVLADPTAGRARPSDQAAENAQPSATDGTGEGLDLVELLTTQAGVVAGGVALAARCPDHRETQLLLDQGGRLHLLRRHAPGTGEGHDLTSLRAAVVELLEARQWVRRHLELLQLTHRQQTIDMHQPPVLHLFTHRPDLAAGLSQRLGSLLKLHLLQHVQLRQESGWHCTPLN
jgi:hypothetical protein